MRQEITTILKALDNKDPAVLVMEKKIMEVLNEQSELDSFLYNIKEEIRVANFIHSDRQPFYYIYSAVAHLKNEDTNSAKNDLANATQGFRISGVTLNEALAEWLFGFIHFKNGKVTRARQACETSLILLTTLINECEKKGAYNQAKKYKRFSNNIKKFTKEVNGLNKKKPNQKLLYPSMQISLPWIPIYDSVRAGPNGMIWADHPQRKRIGMGTIEIEESHYTLHPINLKDTNKKVYIRLTDGVDYGLAKVIGQSMNDSKPIPIEEGDYVLFSSKFIEGHDAIIIVGYGLTNDETSIIVKRFLAREMILVSETTDISEDYSPIQLTADHKILGAVLAVAKPIK